MSVGETSGDGIWWKMVMESVKLEWNWRFELIELRSVEVKERCRSSSEEPEVLESGSDASDVAGIPPPPPDPIPS